MSDFYDSGDHCTTDAPEYNDHHQGYEPEHGSQQYPGQEYPGNEQYAHYAHFAQVTQYTEYTEYTQYNHDGGEYHALQGLSPEIDYHFDDPYAGTDYSAHAGGQEPTGPEAGTSDPGADPSADPSTDPSAGPSTGPSDSPAAHEELSPAESVVSR